MTRPAAGLFFSLLLQFSGRISFELFPFFPGRAFDGDHPGLPPFCPARTIWRSRPKGCHRSLFFLSSPSPSDGRPKSVSFPPPMLRQIRRFFFPFFSLLRIQGTCSAMRETRRDSLPPGRRPVLSPFGRQHWRREAGHTILPPPSFFFSPPNRVFFGECFSSSYRVFDHRAPWAFLPFFSLLQCIADVGRPFQFFFFPHTKRSQRRPTSALLPLFPFLPRYTRDGHSALFFFLFRLDKKNRRTAFFFSPSPSLPPFFLPRKGH